MSEIETTLVEFRCNLGNTILHPSHWIPKNKVNSFSISAPNGQAVINVLTFLKEGSGTLLDFGRRLVQQLTGEENSDWTPFPIKDYSAIQWDSDLDDSGATSHWLVCVVQCGDCYHAIVVELIELIAALNWQFYERLVQSFRGIETPPGT